MSAGARPSETPAITIASPTRTWRLTEKVGEGTLSEVWRAAQDPIGRSVAVKLLKSSVAPGSQLGQRFDREAALLASMTHQNIPQVHDAGVTAEGRAFLVMELVDGLSLAALVKRAPGERLPCDVAAVIALKVARALEYVHLRGVIHRDCKPANVLVSRRGEVKLADFGLARDAADVAPEGVGVVGTPAYMSPEQVLGDRLDFRSDLFSFGIVFYEMLTARRPFEEDPARTVMQKIRLDRYVPARRVRRDVPPILERLLGRCLEKVPAHRYPSTGELCDDLNEFLAAAGVSSHEARLVGWLREVNVLDDDGVKRALGAAGDALGPARHRRLLAAGGARRAGGRGPRPRRGPRHRGALPRARPVPHARASARAPWGRPASATSASSRAPGRRSPSTASRSTPPPPRAPSPSRPGAILSACATPRASPKTAPSR